MGAASLVVPLQRLSWHPHGVTLLFKGEDRPGDLLELEDGLVGLDGHDILSHLRSSRFLSVRSYRRESLP